MTYREGISMFQLRYSRHAFKGDLPKMNEQEILSELSVVQAELQNKYYLSVVSSADLSTPRLTLTAGTATYTTGSGAGTLPTDILEVRTAYLDDTLKTTLMPIELSKIRDTIKVTSKPYYYSMYKANGQMVIELDSYPDAAYVLTIVYVPRYDFFYGNAGTNSNSIWSDYSLSNLAAGSFKTPDEWNSILISGAIANVIGDVKLKIEYQNDVTQMLNSRPVHSSNDIPSNDMSRDLSQRRILVPGQDTYPSKPNY